jgi:hypothetical protein
MMRQLSIPKDAPLHLMRMSEDNLVLHKVHNPKMWVFTKEFGSVFEWPKQLEHNKQTYHFLSNEVMPHMAASQYGGYAVYEIRNYIQHPLTHRELGAYMAAVSSIMMQQHIPLKEANDKGAPFIKSYLLNTLDNDEIRAEFIRARGWAAVDKMTGLFTILDNSDEELQRYELHMKG